MNETVYEAQLVVRFARFVLRWRWLALESTGSFELEGAAILVRPDFAWRDEDDRVVMVDWKTGVPRPDEEDLQLAVYGIFARRSWGLGSDHMRAVAAYVGSGEVRERRVDLRDLHTAETRIATSLQQMRELTADGEEADAERFVKTDDLKKDSPQRKLEPA